MKACTTCGVEKALDAFAVDARHRDGRQSRCRQCHGAYQKRRAAENPEHHRELKRQEYLRHRKQAQAYAAAHKEQRRERAKARRERMTPSEVERHREVRRRISAAYLARHPERCKDRIAAWQRANPHKGVDAVNRRRARKLAAPTERIDVTAVGARDGWACGICGQPIDPELRYPDRHSRSVDHVVPLAKGGAHIMSNVRIAHWICNVRRGADRPVKPGTAAS